MATFIDQSYVSLTIPNGTAVSNILTAKGYFGDADILQLFPPVALDAHTYIIQLTFDVTPIASGNWYTWNNNVSNINPPGVGISIAYPVPACTGLRLKDSSGNVAADRTWTVLKRWNAY